MITAYEEEFANRSNSIFNSLKNIKSSYLLDSEIYDFNL